MGRFTQFLTEGWSRNKETGGHSAWASDIQGHEHDTGKTVRCPKCRGDVIVSTLKRHLDREGDTTHWDGKHKCGHHITVYND